MDESCRWLTTQGRIDESIVILKRIAIVNKKTVPDEVFTGFKVIIPLTFASEQGPGSLNGAQHLQTF